MHLFRAYRQRESREKINCPEDRPAEILGLSSFNLIVLEIEYNSNTASILFACNDIIIIVFLFSSSFIYFYLTFIYLFIYLFSSYLHLFNLHTQAFLSSSGVYTYSVFLYIILQLKTLHVCSYHRCISLGNNKDKLSSLSTDVYIYYTNQARGKYRAEGLGFRV